MLGTWSNISHMPSPAHQPTLPYRTSGWRWRLTREVANCIVINRCSFCVTGRSNTRGGKRYPPTSSCITPTETRARDGLVSLWLTGKRTRKAPPTHCALLFPGCVFEEPGEVGVVFLGGVWGPKIKWVFFRRRHTDISMLRIHVLMSVISPGKKSSNSWHTELLAVIPVVMKWTCRFYNLCYCCPLIRHTSLNCKTIYHDHDTQYSHLLLLIF